MPCVIWHITRTAASPLTIYLHAPAHPCSRCLYMAMSSGGTSAEATAGPGMHYMHCVASDVRGRRACETTKMRVFDPAISSEQHLAPPTHLRYASYTCWCCAADASASPSQAEELYMVQ